MNYYVLEPEVAGMIGPKTVFIDRTSRPPLMERFNYEFNGWLGDPLLESICSYIVTESLKDKFLASQATGVMFGPVEITTSGEFDDWQALTPDRHLPRFVWLKVNGVAGSDDFGYTSKYGTFLVVSECILDLLLGSGMSYCDIADFDSWKGRRCARFRRWK